MSIAASQKPIVTLGIETSCDETALALIKTDGQGADFTCQALSSLVHSQAELHSAYGGVFPTLAKREHGKNLVPLLHKLMIEAGELLGFQQEGISGERFEEIMGSFSKEIAPQNPELYRSFSEAKFLCRVPRIDRIAVTEGPGLEPALWVGINLARMLSTLWKIPVEPMDHMEGHIVGSLFPSEVTNGAVHRMLDAPMPAVALLISGGHTQLVSVRRLGDYEIIGETADDAVGEAFDKAARLLGLGYPGGSNLSRLAGEARNAGISAPVKLPRPMIGSKDLAFSFSGLKTAVLYATRKAPRDPDGEIEANWKKGLAREFEDAVKETLDSKLRSAIDRTGARSIIVGGGVSANGVLRTAFESTAREYGIPIFLPSHHVSGDNALMIALASALGNSADDDEKKSNKLGHRSIHAQGTKRLSI